MSAIFTGVSVILAVCISGWAQVTLKNIWARVIFALLAVLAGVAAYIVLAVGYVIWRFSGVLDTAEAHEVTRAIGRDIASDLTATVLAAALGGFIVRRLWRRAGPR